MKAASYKNESSKNRSEFLDRHHNPKPDTPLRIYKNV